MGYIQLTPQKVIHIFLFQIFTNFNHTYNFFKIVAVKEKFVLHFIPFSFWQRSLRDCVSLRRQVVQSSEGRQSDPMLKSERQRKGEARDRNHEQTSPPQANASAGRIWEWKEHDYGHGIVSIAYIKYCNDECI